MTGPAYTCGGSGQPAGNIFSDGGVAEGGSITGIVVRSGRIVDGYVAVER